MKSNHLANRRATPRVRLAAALLAAVCCLNGSTSASALAQGQSVVWGQEVFVIPYRWSGGSDRSNVSEVVLYVSQDQGNSWNQVTRARPDVQSFMYRAPQDGEFWFAIRTLDTAGGAWPHGPLQGELSVTVDTRIPKVSIDSSSLTADGRLAVDATVNDLQLDSSSIAASVLDPITGQWRPLRASVMNAGPGAATLKIAASLPPGTRNARVRVTAKDLAGNPASAGATVSAEGVPAHSASVKSHTPVAIVPADPFTHSTAFQPRQQSPSTLWPSEPLSALPNAGSWQSSATPSQPWRPDNQPLPTVATSPPAASQAPSAPNSAYRFASNSSSPLPASAPSQPRPDRLLVNSNRFELQYNLNSIGPWGVSKVEVWGTADQGQTWRSFAIDTDQRSPVDIQTPGDGLYGFTIRVQSVGGLEQPTPQPGDKPDMLVEVDRARPEVSLDSASQPDGYFADHLVFTWRVRDENLSERPVSLLYAARPSGPWQPIASNLDNTGRYSWRLQRHLPAEVCIRLEARDRAGNIGVDHTDQPVAIHLPESSGQILQVRPLE